MPLIGEVEKFVGNVVGKVPVPSTVLAAPSGKQLLALEQAEKTPVRKGSVVPTAFQPDTTGGAAPLLNRVISKRRAPQTDEKIRKIANQYSTAQVPQVLDLAPANDKDSKQSGQLYVQRPLTNKSTKAIVNKDVNVTTEDALPAIK